MPTFPSTARPIARIVIVVVGASGPRGAAVAHAAAAAGARVLLVGANEAALGEAVRAINNAGGVCDYAVAPDGHREALAAAGRVARARFGPIDTWIDTAADNRERIDATRAAASPLLDREGGRLVLVVPPGLTLDKDRAGGAPGATLSLLTAAADIDADTVAAAVMRCLERPRPAMTIRARGFARQHGGVIAALGVGGLAIAAGAVALLRRNARRRG